MCQEGAGLENAVQKFAEEGVGIQKNADGRSRGRKPWGKQALIKQC